jgi:hypothetical protein
MRNTVGSLYMDSLSDRSDLMVRRSTFAFSTLDSGSLCEVSGTRKRTSAATRVPFCKSGTDRIKASEM